MGNDMHEKVVLNFAWISVAANFVTHNFSVILSVMCAFAALGASIYSIIVNRARLKLLKEIHNESSKKDLIMGDGDDNE